MTVEFISYSIINLIDSRRVCKCLTADLMFYGFVFEFFQACTITHLLRGQWTHRLLWNGQKKHKIGMGDSAKNIFFSKISSLFCSDQTSQSTTVWEVFGSKISINRLLNKSSNWIKQLEGALVTCVHGFTRILERLF